jgi:hypothetical protein
MTTPSVGGIKFLEFTQSTPATVWTIYHAFGVHPIIDVNVNTAGVIAKAFPMSIEHADLNTSIVRWSTARMGTATLAATVA